MATEKQLAANRRNAQRSTGPRTPEGKAAVSRNRLSHGLAGEHVVLPDEDPAAYDRLLAALMDEHRPSSPTGEFLVRQLAQAQWKLDRVARMDAALLSQQMAESPEPDPASAFRRDCSGGA